MSLGLAGGWADRCLWLDPPNASAAVAVTGRLPSSCSATATFVLLIRYPKTGVGTDRCRSAGGRFPVCATYSHREWRTMGCLLPRNWQRSDSVNGDNSSRSTSGICSCSFVERDPDLLRWLAPRQNGRHHRNRDAGLGLRARSNVHFDSSRLAEQYHKDLSPAAILCRASWACACDHRGGSIARFLDREEAVEVRPPPPAARDSGTVPYRRSLRVVRCRPPAGQTERRDLLDDAVDLGSTRLLVKSGS